MAVPTSPHRSVLLAEVLEALCPFDGGTYVDCTVGAGGHAEAVLDASSPGGRLLGIDADPSALDLAAARLRRFGERVRLERANYRELDDVLAGTDLPAVDGILFDLGVSSMQLDEAARGFSFQTDGPLDMRMDPTRGRTAADVVNTLPESDLSTLIAEDGEERFARRVARAIAQRRANAVFHNTADLARTIASAIPDGGRREGKRGGRDGGRGIHPATRTFQALRIAVNGELEGLREALPKALDALRPGGRMAVISFHSLEDRIVKRFFLGEVGRCVCPPQFPVCRCDARARLTIVTKKPLVATAEEERANPRSRSAKLRVAEKLLVEGVRQ